MYNRYIKIGNNLKHNQQYTFISFGEIYEGKYNKFTKSFHKGKTQIKTEVVSHIRMVKHCHVLRILPTRNPINDIRSYSFTQRS